jgi:hypothetical protein
MKNIRNAPLVLTMTIAGVIGVILSTSPASYGDIRTGEVHYIGGHLNCDCTLPVNQCGCITE